MVQLQRLDIMDRHALWKRLNKGVPAELFVTVLRRDALPKRAVREDPPASKPAGKNLLWCCYCGDWTVFVDFAYVGSQKCIGCGISTKDYHNRSANNLWKVDL